MAYGQIPYGLIQEQEQEDELDECDRLPWERLQNKEPKCNEFRLEPLTGWYPMTATGHGLIPAIPSPTDLK